MSRPKKERFVCTDPNIKCFWPKLWNDKPEIVEIFCDELEAIKLINLDAGGTINMNAPKTEEEIYNWFKKIVLKDNK